MDSNNQTPVLTQTFVNDIIPRSVVYQGIHLINRKYIMPTELALGITGNLLILITLLKCEKKLRSSKLNLIAMAFADALFLLLHMPQIFVIYDFARTSYRFMYLYVSTLPSQMMLINTCYTASVW